MEFVHHYLPYVLLAAAALAAGAINSVAGGGTLITFPSLVAFGLPVLTANGTSTVALVPGSFSAAFGYRREFGRTRRLMLLLAAPSILGGFVGAKVAVRINDHAYALVVPWLILGATVLFILNGPIGRWIRSHAAGADDADDQDAVVAPEAEVGVPLNQILGTMAFQFFVAVYGGFFGAGIGILMLAALGFLGLTNIHRMNGLKNVAAICINLVASFTFIFSRRVDWPLAILMAVAASAGGLGGAKLARRLGQHRVRRIVVLIGFSIAAWMFWKQFHGLV